MLKSLIGCCGLGLAIYAAATVSLAPQPAFSQAQGAQTDGLIEAGITKPQEERKLAFNGPGLVMEVKVKVGDKVAVGDVLAQQDVSLELSDKAVAEVEANSKVQEKYARADKGVKEKELQRKQILFKSRNATELEVAEAQLAVERADASVELAIQEREIAKLKVAGFDARIALKTIKSPIDGFVQSVETGVGEQGSVDSQQKPALVVVKNNPLKVDVNVPIPVAKALKVGQTLQVRYIDDENASWRQAKVMNLKPVADRGSQTRALELQLPNDEGREAGLRVEVRIPNAVASAPAAGDAQVGAGR